MKKTIAVALVLCSCTQRDINMFKNHVLPPTLAVGQVWVDSTNGTSAFDRWNNDTCTVLALKDGDVLYRGTCPQITTSESEHLFTCCGKYRIK